MSLIIKDLCKMYDFPVFENKTLVFNSNLCHLVGENGSGKSTLLKILSGKIKCDSGEIYLDNNKVSTSYLAQNSVLVNQDINLFLNETVDYNIKFIAGKIDNKIIEEFGFKEDLKKNVNELSGGYKKKLMIMISFMLNPNILLLDEYSSYLDKESLDIINKKIIEYSKDHLVIYVDHNDTLNGDIIDIDKECELEIYETKKEKNKFYFKHNLSLFELISFIFMIIFLTLTQASLSFNEISSKEIAAHYLKDNDMWYQMPMKNTSEYNYYYVYNTRDHYYSYYITYTLDDFPILYQSDIEYENECYVFNNKKDLYEQYITVNDTNYFVKGVIDLKCDKYRLEDREGVMSEIESLLDTIVVKDEKYVKDLFLYAKMLNAKNDIYNLFLDEKICDSFSFYCINYAANPYKIMIISTIIFFIIFIVVDSKKKKEIYNVLGSYKNSKKNLYLSLLIEVIISGIFIIIISYGCSYFMLYCIYQNLIPKFNVRFMVPIKYVIIFYLIFFISFVISIYFVAVRKRSDDNNN